MADRNLPAAARAGVLTLTVRLLVQTIQQVAPGGEPSAAEWNAIRTAADQARAVLDSLDDTELAEVFPLEPPPDPAEIEADIDAFMAASESERRDERLECGVIAEARERGWLIASRQASAAASDNARVDACKNCLMPRTDWPARDPLYRPDGPDCPSCTRAACADEAAWKRRSDT